MSNCMIIKQEAQLTNLRDAFGGQSRSPNIVPFHMLGIVSYCATVTVSLRRAVFTIFDLKNVVTLKDSIALCMPTIVCEKGVYAEQLDERFAHDPKRRIHIPTSSATKNIQPFICGEDQMSPLVNLHVHPAEVCRQFVLHQPGP